MYFKLSVNATRKAKWYAKLGFLKPNRPLVVSLDSIKPNSTVGAIDVIIDRVYPILVKHIFNFLNKRNILNKILQYQEKKPDGSKVYRNQKQEEAIGFNNLNKSKEYYDADTDYDLSVNKQETINMPPPKQSESVKREVCQVLKLRVSDSFNKKNLSCLITVWQNAMDLYEKIKEGQRLVFFNLGSIMTK